MFRYRSLYRPLLQLKPSLTRRDDFKIVAAGRHDIFPHRHDLPEGSGTYGEFTLDIALSAAEQSDYEVESV